MYRRILVGCGVLLLMGCAHMNRQEAQAPSSDDPMIARLREGIDDLKENMVRLHGHVEELNKTPPSEDQTIEEVRAFDIAGWRLHDQQWQAQLAHLTFALDCIRQAEATSSLKGRLRQEWLAAQEKFTATLDELRKERHQIERKRLQLESGLVQHYLE